MKIRSRLASTLTEAKFERETTMVSRYVIDKIKPAFNAFMKGDAAATNGEKKIGTILVLDDVLYKIFPQMQNQYNRVLDQIAVQFIYSPGMPGAEGSGTTHSTRVGNSLLPSSIIVRINFPDSATLNDIINELKEVLRHEVEHAFQSWEKRVERSSYGVFDKAKGIHSTTQIAAYLLQPSEIEAHVVGLYKLAKMKKVPLRDVFEEKLYEVESFMELLPDSSSETQDQILRKVRSAWKAYAKTRFPDAQL